MMVLMGIGRYVEVVAGVAILLLIFHDLFQSVVLPRSTVYRVRLASQLLIRLLWIVWRWVGIHCWQDKRESFLGVFGPAGLLLLLAFWSLLLVLDYNLI